ncbi:SUMF1/EgtB/PvdO family nonheme iron enzyme [Nodularia harveyana UHCC-0300]|uniref:SUMF1/EgtB/PvdO family nonheme iron enzyme n=1 Tax=Nodularia harveyana UHCC-0300 TaxID=2974287 RepID=A0ABU5UCA6_9CYAN|nr:SUMF1/EgtB/PvdO family nonheme iron enzyme [Nodularia harveyana]MEA5581177.1 SUMF1/EgtB/PvdO family nonheme iron enzyme [Nodularia harveyana UHCC-0300]
MADLRFRVGLSFPGEARDFVEKVAQELALEWSKHKIFYDNFHEAELAIPNLDIHLQNIYHKQCDLVVIFIGKDYERKDWCRLEWRAIRDLIKTKIQKSPSAIMPIRIDSGDVSGLFSIDGYIDIRGRKPHEIASLINQRLSSLGYSHSSFTTPPPPSPPEEIPESSPELQKFEFKFAKLIITEEKKLGNADKIQRNDYSGKAEGFTEDLGQGVKLEMVKIPGGTFMMGASNKEEGSRDNERPEHQVTVPDFYMGRYLVTQAQWARVAASLPQINSKLDPRPSHFKGNENLPVDSVSWDDAVEFCARLSKATGRDYRLPSEAEWEYACRAHTYTPFHFGDVITTEVANYNGEYSPKGEYRQKTTPVGSFPPNAFGLYDMHGNLWEWCLDTWHSNYDGAPKDGSAWINNDNQVLRLLRGGSWPYDPGFCRSASRNNLYPDNAYSNIGFRVVCSSEAARTL